jgi:hypothetical protein
MSMQCGFWQKPLKIFDEILAALQRLKAVHYPEVEMVLPKLSAIFNPSVDGGFCARGIIIVHCAVCHRFHSLE